MVASRFPAAVAFIAVSLTNCARSQNAVMPPSTAHGAQRIIKPASIDGYRILYNFKGGSDGWRPWSTPIALDGNLYGTTRFGGMRCQGYGCGTIFVLSASGVERVVHRFNADNGKFPFAGLIEVGDVLYGTTSGGGGAAQCTGGCGTVYKFSRSGNFTVLYRFKGAPDGDGPAYGNLLAVNGVLYGTTYMGGATGVGSVFAVTPSGAEHIVYSFKKSTHDGGIPLGGVIDVGGTLYGTTSDGGRYGISGTVFGVTPGIARELLYSFNGPDGQYPDSTLVAFRGELYGTTSTGGAGTGSRCPCGVVFKIGPYGQEQTLYDFNGTPDGARPIAGLTLLNGRFYGTTSGGGASNKGTVFEITPIGKERVLYSFKGAPDGDGPDAALVAARGTLYGTTTAGGAYNIGTVFEIKP